MFFMWFYYNNQESAVQIMQFFNSFPLFWENTTQRKTLKRENLKSSSQKLFSTACAQLQLRRNLLSIFLFSWF